MGERAGDVLGRQRLVEADRRVDLFHDRVGCAVEAATPHLVAHRTPEPRSGKASMTATPDDPQGKGNAGARRAATPRLAVFALLAVAAGAAGLYEITQHGGKPVAHSGACARSLDAARAIDPLIQGELAALVPARQPARSDNRRVRRCRRSQDDDRHPSPARRCCSIFGRHGACRAGRKCRRSTACRRSSAPRASVSCRSTSTSCASIRHATSSRIPG